MNGYQEFQSGRWMYFTVFVLLIILNTAIFWRGPGYSSTLNFFIVSNVIWIFLMSLFYRMVTTVNGNEIVVSYGIGLIKKKISLARVEGVEIVKNSWYWGWGIRFIPHGMLYNIRGLKAVELKLKNSERIIRIGTENPLKLKEEISERLTPRNS